MNMKRAQKKARKEKRRAEREGKMDFQEGYPSYPRIKSRVMCDDCGKLKMRFETKEEAESFMDYADENDFHKHYIPKRAYFCSSCRGWHLSSKEWFCKRSYYTIRLVIENHAPDDWEYVGFDKDAQIVFINKGGEEYVLFPDEVMQQIVDLDDNIERYEINKNDNNKYVIYLKEKFTSRGERDEEEDEDGSETMSD